MINETFDDDIPEDEIDEMMASGTPVEVVTEKPKGDFRKLLSGREVWFKLPQPGQFHAWKRYRSSLAAKFEVLKVQARKNPSIEALQQIQKMSEQFDLSTLELIESLVIEPDDVDFIQFEMIANRITMRDIYGVLFGGDDPESGPEDDVEVAPKPKKNATPKKVAAAKKVASARRTRK